MHSHKSFSSSKLAISIRKLSVPGEKSLRKRKHTQFELPSLRFNHRLDSEADNTEKNLHISDSAPISPTYAGVKFKRFPLTLSSTGRKLGPGCYFRPKSKTDGPSFQFSLIDRFESDPIAKVALTLSKFHTKSAKESESEFESKKRINLNKDMNSFSLQYRMQQLKNKSLILAERISRTKYSKELIYNQAIQAKRQKLHNKFHKYQAKQEHRYTQKAQKSWVVMISYIFSIQLAYRAYYRQNLIRMKTLKTQKLIYILCKCIGKFLRVRTLCKEKRSVMVIQSLKNKHKEGVVDVIETSLTRRMMFRLHACWHHKVLIIQRGIRKLLSGRKLLKLCWRIEWNQMEKRTQSQKKIVMRSKRRLEEVIGTTSIPDEVKDYYMRQFILKRVRQYIQDLSNYQTECTRLKYIFQRRKTELEFHAWGKKIELRLVLPPPPEKNYRMNLEDYREMIKDAISYRNKWDNLIESRPNSKTTYNSM